MRRILLAAFSAALMSIAANAQDKTTIFLAGDSTVADKDYIDGRQERGWGMLFAGYFDNGIDVINRARDGRSTKTFITEHRLDWILENLAPGDYVFLQFGHNDANLKDVKGCPAQGAFKDNLRTMVSEVRAKGGIPVLLTPICRRAFNPDGTVKDTHSQGDTTSYQAATAEVAEEQGVVLLDANARTAEWLAKLGEEASANKYMFGYNGKDNTHLSHSGAKDVCDMVCDEIKDKIPELASHLSEYAHVVSKDGRGDFSTIQEAINAVKDNRDKITAIRILPGKYQESVIIPLGKDNIKLIGSGKDNTIIHFHDASGIASAVTISSDCITLSDITVIRSGSASSKVPPLQCNGRKIDIINCQSIAY